jgi:uncharacterized protein
MDNKDYRIQFLDGNRFNRAIVAASKWLIEREKQLDDINVFPVPDSDTGTNMGGTLRSIALDPEGVNSSSIAESSKLIADSVLMNARGNSGAILAQFFQGLSEGFEKYRKINTQDLAQATSLASIRAAEAVSNPKEGTILTVIREWSQDIERRSKNEVDFSSLLYQSLETAKASLGRTTQQMEVLRKANVVDAGAQGFVYMIEGIVDYMEHGRMRRELWKKITDDNKKASLPNAPESDSIYRYCTECILYGDNLVNKTIQSRLMPFSDSIVVVGSHSKMKIHAHSDQPGKIFQVLQEYGQTDHEKIEDIRQQEKDIYGDVNHDIALVTDTSCDIPTEWIDNYNIHRIPFRITFGKENLIDRITITDHEFYQRMEKTTDLAKTSQLSNLDLKQMYEWTSRNFKNTIAIHIARPLSASIEGAKKVAASTSDTIIAYDSKSICVGLGLIVAHAGRAILDGFSFNDVCKQIEWACDNIQQLFTVEDLKYLIRGGRLKASKGKIATLLNLKPLMHTDPTGALKPFAKAFGSNGLRKKMLKELKKRVANHKNVHFAIGHCNNEATALWYKEQIEKLFPVKSIYVTTISPTIGSHSGPGTISIAFLPDYPG